jgi:hypothetical protein
MIENLKIITEHFPSWFVFIYYAPDVPTAILLRLGEFSRVLLKPTGAHGAINMIHRFFAIDEDGVDAMVVRDADSRIHARDRWSICAWMENKKKGHIIRDHPYHCAAIMGGMWGLKKGLLPQSMRSIFESYQNQHKNEYGADQSFLARAIYRLIYQDTLFHACIQMHQSEFIVPIPFPVKNGEFIGQVVEYQNGLPVPTMEYFLPTS